MPKIFEERHISAAGKVLPYETFRLFCDLEKAEFNPEYAPEIIRRAESLLTAEVPMLPASLYAEFSVNGNRNHFEGPYFRRREMALVLALAELYEKKGRFATKLMDALWAIMEETSWVLPAHLYNHPVIYDGGVIPAIFGDRMHAIDLFAATTGADLAVIYHYCKEALDKVAPAVCTRIEYELHKRIVYPFIHANFWWTGELGNHVNNWCPWINANVLTVIALTERDQVLREKAVARSMGQLDNFVKNYHPDGGCDEGPGYWGVAGAAYFSALEVLYDLTGGKVDVFDHPLVRAIGEYEMKFHIHQDRFINFADSSAKITPNAALIRRFGHKCGSELLERFGESVALRVHNVARIDTSLAYETLRGLLMPKVEKTEPVCLKKVWFENLKVMATHECDDTSRGFFLAMKGGHNDESHNHNDVGNVIVYYGGAPVLIDSGVGTYTKKTFSPQRYELWYMQSSFHNVAEFGGVAQRAGGRFASRDEVYDEATGRVRMELAGAYPEEAGVLSYVRSAVLENGGVTVCDTVSLKEEKEVVFHFLSPVKPAAEAGKISLAEGRTLIYDANALSASVEEFAVDDEGLSRTWGTPVLWRIHLAAKTAGASYTFRVE